MTTGTNRAEHASLYEAARFRGRVSSLEDEAGLIDIKSIAAVSKGTPPLPATIQKIVIRQVDCKGKIAVGCDVLFDIIGTSRGELRATLAEVVAPPDGAAKPAESKKSVPPLEQDPLVKPEGNITGIKPVPRKTRDYARDQGTLSKRFLPESVSAAKNRAVSDLGRLTMAVATFHREDENDLDVVLQESGTADQDMVNKRAEELLEQYRAQGMEGLISDIRSALERQRATRNIIDWLDKRDLRCANSALPPSLTLAILDSIRRDGLDADQRKHMGEAVIGALGFMSDNGLLAKDKQTVFPLDVLPELFMAAPIVYHVLKDVQRATAEELFDEGGHNAALLHGSTNYFSSLFGDNWATTFCLFNRVARPQSRYKGRAIPGKPLNRAVAALSHFDQVAFMTPYHQQAGPHWSPIRWQSGNEIFTVGLIDGLDVVFFLGRMSAVTDSLAHVDYASADTIEFLRANLDKVEGFNRFPNLHWPIGGKLQPLPGKPGTYLRDHVIRLLQAFDEKRLFEWLLEKSKTPPPDGDVLDVVTGDILVTKE